MSIFKCKMCDGTIEFDKGATVGVCDSCGTKQTLPRLDDDRRANLYDRANHVKIIAGATETKPVQGTVIVSSGGASAAPLLRRAFMFLEDGEWAKADDFCEQVLNLDPENAQAYLGKLMAELRVHRQEDLTNCEQPFDRSNNFQKAVRFGGDKLSSTLKGYISHINERNKNTRERKAEQARIAAEKAAKKRKKYIAITTPIVIVCIAFVVLLTTVIIPKQKLNKAMEMLDSGDYEAAYILLNGLNYKDSSVQRDSIKKILLAKAEVGSYIFFGSYEQDKNTFNGKEDVEWLVLAKEGNRLLVISRFALDCHKYNSTYTGWEECSLRRWLNGTFINSAFSHEEKAMIPTVTVSADKNPSYSTSPGSSTQDQIFLLSIPEVNQYFSGVSAMCKPSAFAHAQGCFTRDGNCWWWLRSRGGDSYSSAAIVSHFGSVMDDGVAVKYDFTGAIRPALWIDLGS